MTIRHRFFYDHLVGSVAPTHPTTHPLHTASANSPRTYHELLNILGTSCVICVRLILVGILIQLNYEN